MLQFFILSYVILSQKSQRLKAKRPIDIWHLVAESVALRSLYSNEERTDPRQARNL